MGYPTRLGRGGDKRQEANTFVGGPNFPLSRGPRLENGLERPENCYCREGHCTGTLPTDINYFEINYGITVTDSLPTLIVWE